MNLLARRGDLPRLRQPARRAWVVLVVPVLLVGPVLGPSVARADDEQDHERARGAVRAGQVLPLHVLLERLQRDHPGQVLDVELEQDRAGRWTYEIKLLQPGGRRVKLDVDAATGKVMQHKGRGSTPAASGSQ